LSAAAARQRVCKSQRAARAAVELVVCGDRVPPPTLRRARSGGAAPPGRVASRSNLPLYRIKRVVRDCQFARAA
jgi:hypothetical protein